MPVETTYTRLRERLASVLNQVANDQEVVIVRRRRAKAVALVPADELTSLMETAHLLRSATAGSRGAGGAYQGQTRIGGQVAAGDGAWHSPLNARLCSTRSSGRPEILGENRSQDSASNPGAD
jgi:antitoxin YefM